MLAFSLICSFSLICAKSGPPVLLFWPTRTYTNLNSHRELSRRLFYPLEIMDGSDFQKNMPQLCKIGIKNEKNNAKTFYFEDHICTWIVIFKKKVLTLFSNQRAARGFNSFSKSGPFCEKLAIPCAIGYPY